MDRRKLIKVALGRMPADTIAYGEGGWSMSTPARYDGPTSP